VRVLIAGAGVAGLTLAARLAQQGRPPVVVERSAGSGAGYAIGLYPLGSCVLHGLGRYGELLARGLVVNDYELADHAGRVMKRVDMSVLTGQVGPLVMIDRASLLDILRGACAGVEIRAGVGVRSLVQDRDGVNVALDDGTVEHADLVVGCDGIDSVTRALAGGPAHRYDTGWVLWTWWAAADPSGPPVFREWWGRGWFFGCYPAPGRMMCAGGGPAGQWDSPPAGRVIQAGPGQLVHLLRRFPPASAPAAEPPAMYRWPMRDVRASRWFHGRVALCGDAAAAFLPSAAVGASAAMRSAAALADELSRADAATVPLALELYQKRCRHIVERAQANSRQLARMMLVGRPALAWGRDQLARRYPAQLALSEIIHGSHQPF
jgi:2-polyprenyl-6-methoxyphenol hydroxylase-like FAD-dependent oxidoreductase